MTLLKEGLAREFVGGVSGGDEVALNFSDFGAVASLRKNISLTFVDFSKSDKFNIKFGVKKKV